MGKYKALKSELAVLTKKIDAMSKNKSEKGLVAELFDWDEESLSLEDECVTRVKAFMAIVEDEPVVGKVDARFDYTYVDLHYVEDQRKNLLSKFNSLKQELSSCKYELVDLKDTKVHNISLQHEISRLKLENESLRDEVSYLKKVIEQVPSNILRALGGRGKMKEIISSKEVVFTKADESPYKTIPKITSNSESECENHELLPPLPKLSRVEPIGTSNDVIPLVVLTQLSLKRLKSCSSTEQLLLTLMEEVKGLKEQIKPPSDHSATISQTWSSKSAKGKQKTWKAPKIPNPLILCKYFGFNDHHSNEYEYYPGCDICGSIAHETADCDYLKRYVWYLDSGCSRHMTGVKQYLHRYSKESGSKVVFRDNSLGDTKGYGLVNCNGITFTRVAYANGLKHNLISISQLCDANFKVLFTKTQGTIFNQNNEVVLIVPRRKMSMSLICHLKMKKAMLVSL
ncbi:hypothetical protein Tco_1134571 [Tanacetum coccineum]